MNEGEISAEESACAGFLSINKHVVTMDILALYILISRASMSREPEE